MLINVLQCTLLYQRTQRAFWSQMSIVPRLRNPVLNTEISTNENTHPRQGHTQGSSCSANPLLISIQVPVLSLLPATSVFRQFWQTFPEQPLKKPILFYLSCCLGSVAKSILLMRNPRFREVKSTAEITQLELQSKCLSTNSNELCSDGSFFWPPALHLFWSSCALNKVFPSREPQAHLLQVWAQKSILVCSTSYTKYRCDSRGGKCLLLLHSVFIPSLYLHVYNCESSKSPHPHCLLFWERPVIDHFDPEDRRLSGSVPKTFLHLGSSAPLHSLSKGISLVFSKTAPL
jgi:hypothetical protein